MTEKPIRSAARETPLTRQAEDYLKVIYEKQRDGQPATTNDIAGQLGIAAASVSGMLPRLARLGLVKVERYRGARLTVSGRAAALQLIRRHRIIESFLVTRLGYEWDDVHGEAERLEHAVSAELIDRMADALGNPAADPHGAPIPTSTGRVDERRLSSIADVPVGARARVVRMSDRDPEFLRYMKKRGIVPGATVGVVAREPFDGPITLTVGRTRQAIGAAAAAKVYVDAAR
jgi:DtxR family transcriptional regulator, Mn-dependent transcriptional regulator